MWPKVQPLLAGVDLQEPMFFEIKTAGSFVFTAFIVGKKQGEPLLVVNGPIDPLNGLING